MKIKQFARSLVCLAAASAVMVTNSVTAAPAKKAARQAKPAPTRVQRATITLPEGYTNGAAKLKAGKPAQITFYLKSDAGCGNSVVFPAAKWSKTLKVGEKATVHFTPKTSGTLAFRCSMDMDRGTIVVK